MLVPLLQMSFELSVLLRRIGVGNQVIPEIELAVIPQSSYVYVIRLPVKPVRAIAFDIQDDIGGGRVDNVTVLREALGNFGQAAVFPDFQQYVNRGFGNQV